jgi:hypothetical protein
VLAGEVTSPGSYSLRTLDILKHLSKEEAELFRIACGLAFSTGWIIRTGTDINTTFEPYGLDFTAILSLRNAGLVYEDIDLIKGFNNLGATPSIILKNNGLIIQLSGQPLENIRIPALGFTRTGSELQNLIDSNPCMPYLQSVAVYLRQKGVSVKKSTQIDNDSDQEVFSFSEDF